MTRPTAVASRFAKLLAVCGVVLLAAAPTAAADPAKPSNYRSEVLSITPASPAITVKVVGGDGFLELRVERGHTVDVEGYEGDPWLRVLADGTVQENQRSTATYLNANRYGSAVIPPGVGGTDAIERPEWKTVGHRGTHIWHDHRIHYMTPEVPPKLVPGTNRVLLGSGDDGRWIVPLEVDGKPVEVVGQLLLLQAPNALGSWAVVALIVVGAAIAASAWQRRAALGIAIALTGVGAAAGLLAGWSELSVVPSEAGGNPVAVALPAFALLSTVVALVLRNRATRCIAVLAAAAALLAWAILRIGALSHALPLTGLHPAVARLLVAITLGAALGAAVAGVRSGALALSPLEDLDEVDEPHPAGLDPPKGRGQGTSLDG